MATSGTYSFTVTRDDVINAALRAMGVISAGQTASSDDLINCTQALNLILKAWAKKGLLVWTIDQQALPLVAGKGTYTVGSGAEFNTPYHPPRLLSAFLRNNASESDVVVLNIAKSDYDLLGNKTSQSIVNQVWYDPQLPLGVLYVYSVPQDANYTLYATFQRPLQDITSATDNFDLSQDFFLPLKWSLVEETCWEYGLSSQRIQLLQNKARSEVDDSFNFETESTSVYFSVDPQTYYGN